MTETAGQNFPVPGKTGIDEHDCFVDNRDGLAFPATAFKPSSLHLGGFCFSSHSAFAGTLPAFGIQAIALVNDSLVV
jgi:hypothetical protein